MVDNTKTTRIFTLLSNAKDKGLKEIELFNDFETANNVRVIKHNLNRILGGTNAILIRNGTWYLSEDYWNMTKSEFKDTMNRYNQNQQLYMFGYIILSTVAIMAILVVSAYFIGKEGGEPRTLQECGLIFDTDIILQ